VSRSLQQRASASVSRWLDGVAIAVRNSGGRPRMAIIASPAVSSIRLGLATAHEQHVVLPSAGVADTVLAEAAEMG